MYNIIMTNLGPYMIIRQHITPINVNEHYHHILCFVIFVCLYHSGQFCVIWLSYIMISPEPVLSLARSKLRLYSANHRPGFWGNLPCDWPSTTWAYSKHATGHGPWCFFVLFPDVLATPGVSRFSYPAAFFDELFPYLLALHKYHAWCCVIILTGGILAPKALSSYSYLT